MEEKEKSKRILITGSAGQIGSELTPELRKIYGNENVIAAVHRKMPDDSFINAGPFEILDVSDKESMKSVIEKYDIGTIYHLVSILSAVGEKEPELAWNVNMNGLKNVLDLARDYKLKVFWPSSIAAFGPTTPRDNTPQKTILEPSTMYGITKVSGELLASYYFQKYNVDIRSVRYPGLISYKTLPGGGTTDYAVEIFYEALKRKKYTCFVREDTVLPMMYMADAIRATIQLMMADSSKIKIRTSYNLAAMSFSAKELSDEIKKHIPEFRCEYAPDSRQKIADSWPRRIDDSCARKDWGWKHEYDLARMTSEMLEKLEEKMKGN
ncbi:MAG: L-threonine 3-dehydrogenase [Candidatus Woesearchaeota archaeon]|nr:L-threonine 3-dehydrogenase [Candidatus Woesearchaeota archaeon]